MVQLEKVKDIGAIIIISYLLTSIFMHIYMCLCMHPINAFIFHHFVFGYLTIVPHNLCTPNGKMLN